MITISKSELKEKAEKLKDLLQKNVKGIDEIAVEEVKDQIGGGTAPDVYLDGYAVTATFKKYTPEKIERVFRDMDVPIIVRVAHDKIYFDVRTILTEDFELLIEQISKI